jgi:hypothetical protein
MARFKIGDKVILGDHFIEGAQRDFNEDHMPAYVGKQATIVRAYGERQWGMGWYVDIDGGQYYWYEQNMKPYMMHPDQRCCECRLPAPHCEPNLPDKRYICSFCKAMKDLGELTPQEKYEKNWEATFGKKT